MTVVLWHYAQNQFLNATRNNFKKMLLLDDDHYAKLVNRALVDPDIVPIKTDYEPFHTAYVNIYSNWQGAGGSREGQTFTVEGLFKQMPDLLPVWEGQVFAIFPANTGDAHSIFPDKRKPFETGTYAQRIEALKTLYEKLGTYSAYPTIMTLSGVVQSFYNQVSAARVVQQGDEVSVSAYSALLESQRKLNATAMYGDLGRLMYKYRENPVEIQYYWDMSLLRDISMADFIFDSDITLPLTAITIPDDVFAAMQADTPVKIKNKNTFGSPLQFSLSDSETAAGPVVVSVGENQENQYIASQIGWAPGRKFLIIVSNNLTASSVRVEIEV